MLLLNYFFIINFMVNLHLFYILDKFINQLTTYLYIDDEIYVYKVTI